MKRVRAAFTAPAGAAILFGLLVSFLARGAAAQESPLPPAAAPAAGRPTAVAASSVIKGEQDADISEDELRNMLLGKTFYLRGCYLGDSLNFDELGRPIGYSHRGSYTLSLVKIEKVKLSRHKLELEGVRYGLHFLSVSPYQDPAGAADRVRITPKKKFVRITIARAQVEKARKERDEKPAKAAAPGAAVGSARPGQRSATASAMPATTAPELSARILRRALNAVFAPGLDARMIAAMPDFWKLYYQAAAAKTDFRPGDAAVLLESEVDRKARLLTRFEPGSNEYAQQAGIAGMALYNVVVGADGAVQQVAVARPIGFGLDEIAVNSICKARFEPALKNGKPVPVLLDLVVEFRIYSKQTAAESAAPEDEAPARPALPGPYSIPHPK